MSLPDYTVWFRGLPACPCLAEWLPVFESELLRRRVIKKSIDIAQLIGGAKASADTHTKGGAADIWQHDPVTVKVAREMGAAAFARTAAQGFSPHTHLVLNGCPHNGPAAYQIAALADGFNGLGKGGRGGVDDGPLPRKLRTWREGIAWAERRQTVNELNAAMWNLRVGRKPATVVAEVTKFLDDHDIDVLLVCESHQYVRPLRKALKGKYRVGAFPALGGSAADSAVISRKGLKVGPRRLHRLERQGWERKPGRKGLHWPRSAVSRNVAGIRFIATHMPPGPFGPKFPLRKTANERSFRTLTRLGKRLNKVGRPWVDGPDKNRLKTDPVSRDFLKATGATAHGEGIDWTAAVGVQITNVKAHTFGTSDHKPKTFTVTKENR